MFKKILLGLGALVAIVLTVAAFQPASYSLSRSTVVAAPPAKVFAEIEDPRRYNAWNPFAKMDPESKMSYEGPSSGIGAAVAWDGKKAGAGKMTAIKHEKPSLVLYRLDFSKPMASTAEAEFTVQPEGQGSKVTWTMRGQNNLVAKTIHLFMDLDKAMGPYFEQGLADLKAIAESPAPAKKK